MPALTAEIESQPYPPKQQKRKARFNTSVEKLTDAQLRWGSLYSRLRAFVPWFVLGIVWLWAIRWRTHPDFDQLLERSVTVRHLLLAGGIVSIWNLWLGFSSFKRETSRTNMVAEISRLAAASFACSLLLLIGNLTPHRFSQGLTLASLTTLGMLLTSSTLLLLFLIGATLSSRVLRKRAAVIVGSGRRATLLREQLARRYSPYHVYGCVDDEYVGNDVNRDVYLGKLETLEDLLKAHPIESVLIGLPMKSKYDEIQRVIQICETVGVESQYMHDIFETSHARLQIHSKATHDFTVLSTAHADPKQLVKRAIDVAGASLLLVLFSPVMLAAALAVRLTSPGPVLFKQQRFGKHRRRFAMLKFRSMVADAEQRQYALEERNEAQGPVFKLKYDPRVTPVGKFLRRTSIDELPQLLNVLRGEMSLVGPRPLPLRDVSRFEECWLLRRFSVRPGLTCIWQVSGRSNTSFDDWIRQDLTYIDSWSLTLDLKILALTIPAVLRGSGAV